MELAKGLNSGGQGIKSVMGLEPRGQVIKFSRRLTVQGQRVKELPKGLRLLPACSYRCFFPKAFSLQHFEIKLLPKKEKQDDHNSGITDHKATHFSLPRWFFHLRGH